MERIAGLVAQRYPLLCDLFTKRLKFTLLAFAALFAATAFSQYAVAIAQSEDLFTRHGPIVGGDFIVFRAAALAAGTPDMIAIYEMENLSALLRRAYPGHGDMMFGWFYPPTMYLLLKPLAYPPYLASFAIWSGGFAALFVIVLRSLWRKPGAIALAILSPAVFVAIVTGQNGLLTASLIAIVASFADRRPIIAGVAAGILTLKPQFGLLIPLAFAAGGCWRAFAAAAATALLLAGASIAAFGIDPWAAFFRAVAVHGGRLADSGFPFHKLATPFGAANLIGAAPAALLVQSAATLGLAAYIFIVWRRAPAWDLRLAALATAAPLATPYAFYYEIAIVIPALMMIARRAVETGWLRGEGLSLAILWTAMLFAPGSNEAPAFPISFALAFGAFAVAARRTLPAAGITFASARKKVPAAV